MAKGVRKLMAERYEAELLEMLKDSVSHAGMRLAQHESRLKRLITARMQEIVFDESKLQALYDAADISKYFEEAESRLWNEVGNAFPGILADLRTGEKKTSVSKESEQDAGKMLTYERIMHALDHLSEQEKYAQGVSGHDIALHLGIPASYSYTVGGRLARMAKAGRLENYERKGSKWFRKPEGEAAAYTWPRQTLYSANLGTHGFLEKAYHNGKIIISSRYKYTGSKGRSAAQEIQNDLVRFMKDAGIANPHAGIREIKEGYVVELDRQTHLEFKEVYKLKPE